jgi:membrane protease YdiL (CAAX protease family)
MPQVLVLVLLLALILGFFSQTLQANLRAAFHARPLLLWAAPVLLTAVFAAATLLVNAARPLLIAAVFAYTVAPVICVRLGYDFLAIAALWLPIEFAAGARLVPHAAQGFLHSVAYGIAIVLGLTLFLCYRSLPGMKFNLPRRAADFWLPVVAFGVLAPVLAVVGITIGFIPLPHAATASGNRMAAAIGLIFVATALPEEILFRSLIQNLIEKRLGVGWPALLTASVIFGCAHLDNGPQALPNWRYAILATIAGVAYGRVFQRASSVTSSAMLHMMVDWTKHFFF